MQLGLCESKSQPDGRMSAGHYQLLGEVGFLYLIPALRV
jgi:hypothetical protein